MWSSLQDRGSSSCLPQAVDVLGSTGVGSSGCGTPKKGALFAVQSLGPERILVPFPTDSNITPPVWL